MEDTLKKFREEVIEWGMDIFDKECGGLDPDEGALLAMTLLKGWRLDFRDMLNSYDGFGAEGWARAYLNRGFENWVRQYKEDQRD